MISIESLVQLLSLIKCQLVKTNGPRTSVEYKESVSTQYTHVPSRIRRNGDIIMGCSRTHCDQLEEEWVYLYSLCHPTHNLFNPHSRYISVTIRYPPDGC
jgi:hypothetical protein